MLSWTSTICDVALASKISLNQVMPLRRKTGENRQRMSLHRLLLGLLPAMLAAQPIVLDPNLHHLRIAGEREWSSFPEAPESDGLTVRFDASCNDGEATLILRRQDLTG